MTTTFERVALGAAVAFVGLGIAASLVLPTASATLPPQATLALPGRAADSAVRADKDGRLMPATLRLQDRGLIVPRSVASLERVFHRVGYDLKAVRTGDAPVPRLFVAAIPTDLGELVDVELRKRLFFKAVLPLVLKVNERILRDRERLWAIVAQQRLGEHLSARDELWLAVMAERYKTERGDVEALLERVDVIPPSLALAQAAEESGWGTSRFTREGNALYGQWTWGEQGIVPAGREDGQEHKVRAFENVLHSVEAYVRNLNTHRAYREFRARRADLRADGRTLLGTSLTLGLRRYSERGQEYVRTLDTIIEANRLEAFDRANLTTPLLGANAQPAI